MPVTKTIEFLPTIFQTEVNRKFLNATMDQLVAEPKLNRINGYIGRKFAPTYKSTDSYLREPSAFRTNYQLEPSVVVKDQVSGEVDFNISYPEILQQLNYYGVNTRNQNSLWASEYYSYNPHIDLDKFVNFSQYYWLPNGPDAVDVFADGVDLEKSYEVTANIKDSAYNFTGFYNTPNPDLILARGGEYTFKVNQPGRKFWIQSAPGLSGKQSVLSNLSSREVRGVENNGAETGEIKFIVPRKTDQDFYVTMSKLRDVDLGIDAKYSQIQNRFLSSFIDEFGGIDGQYTATMLDGKYVIFTKPYYDDADWTSNGRYDAFLFDEELHPFDDGFLVPIEKRYGIWKIVLEPVGTLPDITDYVITLQFIEPLPINKKVTIKTGLIHGGTDWFKNSDNLLQQIPAITANLDVLYYQDSEDSALVGVIRLVDPGVGLIDVDAEILNKKNYISPNGVIFTNGLKIRFDSSVTPSTYRNKEYYVEGVGTNITLTLASSLGEPVTTPEYVVINRSSLEKSQWTTINRWFHKDIVRISAYHNDNVPVYDQNSQARRPIIEFEPNLQLFDFGSLAKEPIDVFDSDTIYPFASVEGTKIQSLTSSGVFLDGVELFQGMRIIFANDQDPETRNNIWVVEFVNPTVGVNGPYQIHLVLASDGEAAQGNTVLVKSGLKNRGKNFWFTNNSWNEGQYKSKANQAPRYDVYDISGVSFGDQSVYPAVSIGEFFQGTKIFNYAVGTGPNDVILGFPLKYRNFGNVGDITFENSFDEEYFQYTVDRNNYTVKTNTGRLKRNNPDGTVEWANTWSKVIRPSTQYQIISYVYNGQNNEFVVDVFPVEETSTPNLLVYVNNKLISRQRYITQTFSSGIKVFVDLSILSAGDTVDILVNSNAVSAIGSYQVPVNLDLNAQNASMATMTLGELRNHICALTNSALSFTGVCPGNSNLRDIDVKNYCGTILQQTAGIPFAGMFLTDERANFVDSVIYASQEYTRFKNKFLEIAITNASLSDLSIPESVDAILKQINAIKNKTFPWFYSDMIPYGDDRTVITYKIFNPAVKSYEINKIFALSNPSNRAVIVYYNGTQLVHGQDYTFNSNNASVVIADSFVLAVDAVLTIVEYNNTDGCYIPETPTKLGLHPKFIPEQYVDNTYVNPVTMIRGHDGSLTPAFGDFRDDLLLELEKRIYNNLKVAYDEQHFSIYNAIPGKFRDTGVSLANFNTVLGKSFMQWAGVNRLDYINNTTWDRDNAFTWNYRSVSNKLDGDLLPGSWRACYEYFYDTQTPHLTPWEMLGFSEKPTWWEEQYGPAPYTGGNLILWNDLARGYIAQGPRQGVDARFARPSLLSIIPVNTNGELLPPIGSITTQYIIDNTNFSWSVGNIGPVENAWRNSSDYAFALQIAVALTKPGNYFGLNINNHLMTYDKELGQYLNTATRQRLTQNDVVINGNVEGNQVHRASGYLNWIGDYLRNAGINPAVYLKKYISKYDVKLSYRMAGFSDKKYLKVLAEQYSPNSSNDSVLIPDSDYDLVVNKSTPVQKIVYSAVIVEKTQNGFKVSGYDVNNPTFNIVPPELTGETYDVSVLNQSATIYKKYRRYRVSVPYGYEFSTVQQVSNFLVGYGIYLTSQGFRFDQYNEDLQEIKNWVLSVKEFLFWAQQGWQNNSVLVLSPAANSLNVTTNNAVVDKIGNTAFGSRVLNQNFRPLGSQFMSVVRDRNQFTCSLINDDMIGLIDLTLVQYEHVMIFNNTTMFNDIIYRPELGMRQARLKLVGFKTAEWTGNLDPKGFVYNSDVVAAWQPMKDYLKGDLVDFKGINYVAANDLAGSAEFNFTNWIRSAANIKNGLLPNFAFNSSISESFYDIDSVNLESQYDQFGKGLIGFKNRNYLDMLGVDDISQVKFYQGFIKEKGTPKSFNALANVTFSNVASSVELSEEWAFRVGEYGALDLAQSIDLELNDQQILSNPFSIQVTSGDSEADVVVRTPYKTSDANFEPPIFLDRTSNTPRITDIQTAGFVNIDDIDITMFDISSYSSLNVDLSNIGAGTKIWCAKDFSYSWNVFRVTERGYQVTSITNALDGLIQLTTDLPHNLESGDVVLVKNAGEFSGFYRVFSTPTISTFIVKYDGDLTGFTGYYNLAAPVFSLHSMKFNYAFEIANFNPRDGWKETDIAWVLNNGEGKWGVYKKEIPWNFQRLLPVGETTPDAEFGTAVNLSLDNNFALIGKPNASNGVGKLVIYARAFNRALAEQDSMTPTANDTLGFGTKIEQGTQWAVVGAPESAASRGYAFTVYRSTLGQSEIRQPLIGPDSVAGDRFGASVTISQDDQWIYVGAPGADAVYCYAYVGNTKNFVTNLDTTSTVSSYVLSFVPDSVDAITVSSSTRDYLPYIDFTVSGSTLTFLTTPPTDKLIVRQRAGFRYITKISGVSDTKFGFSVSTATNGAQLVVGAPYENVTTTRVVKATDLTPGSRYQIATLGTSNFVDAGATANTVGTEFIATAATIGTGTVYEVLVNAGAVYVYDRTIEAFTASGEKAFNTLRPVTLASKVRVNDVIQGRQYTADTTYTYEVNPSGQVQFIDAPAIGTTVSIETNQFILLDRAVADEPKEEAQLGYAVDLCPTNCSLYVGSPYYSDIAKNSGAVYRFFNQGRTLGYTTGTVQNPVVTSGDSIRINDYEITFLETSLTDVVAAINAKQIPGVIASNDNGYLHLTSDIKISRNRLRVLAGNGTAINDLGLVVFPQVQMMTNPYGNSNEFFGKKVRITRTLPDTTLLIGSENASTYKDTTFDNGKTIYDRNSTNHYDKATGSGAVYVYTYLNDARETVQFPAGLLTFVQQLVPKDNSLDTGDQFGFDFDIQDNTILVGAPAESSILKNAGQVYEFTNPNRYLGWRLLREETAKVDIESFNRFYLWNKNSNIIISTLDYIDPAKGKVLGTAEQEIKYKTVYDPASYNVGTNPSVDITALRHWSDKQVGQVWWDLDKVRYIDYEQESVLYKTTNWGKMFPGSSIDVYEWVESLYLPSQYVANGGDGIPKYQDDSAYVAITVIDNLSNQEYNKYYYWVKNKATVDTNRFGRKIPVLSVKHLIENPKGQNVKFAAVVQNDTVALFNCGGDIVGTDTVLHIDYDSKLNSSIIHSEWELIDESPSLGLGVLPAKIFNKLIDSLSGIDAVGNSVPDPFLPVQDRYGIEVRPRQSMVIDRNAAVKTLVDNINEWFAAVPLALEYNISELSTQEAIPPANSEAWDFKVPNIETLGFVNIIIQPVGYKVLVESDSTVDNLWTIYVKKADNTWFLSRVQQFNDAPYWSFVDWYAAGYDESTVPTYTVGSNADIAKLSLKAGDIIKIMNDGSGNFRLIRISQTQTDTIGLQNGTVKFNTNLYDLESGGMGFGNDNFDAKRFDQNPSIELRNMLEKLFNTVLVDKYAAERGQLLQLIINYILTEQKYVDWMFKTSFVSVLHKLRKLTQPAIYTKDNQDFYLEYLNEIKPYHTTIREYVIDYEGVDNVNGYVTDFDVPAYFDAYMNMYRSPSGEYYQDTLKIQDPVYKDWLTTYTYSIPTGLNSVRLNPARRGKGYLEKPVITVTGSSIGNDAIAEAVFDYSTGQITAINVTRAGTGYIGKTSDGSALAPKVTITGGSLPVNATVFEYGLVAQVGQNIKTSSAQYFTVTEAGVLGYELRYNADLTVGDAVRNGTATLTFVGEEAFAFAVLENNTTRKIKTTMVFDRITYGSTVKVWEPNTQYHTGDLISFNNIVYQADTNVMSGSVFSGTGLSLYDGVFNNANDRIQAYYAQTTGTAGKSFDLLETGIRYPGVTVTGPLFSETPFFDSGAFDNVAFDSFEIGPDGTVGLSQTLLDTIISSSYNDSNLGIRPEDINVDGGAYVDIYNSHAPEELIPGRVFDTLDLQVHQIVSPAVSNTAVLGIDIEFSAYKVTQPNEAYAYGNGKEFNDVLYVYSNLSGRLEEGIDYTINYFDKTISMIKPLSAIDTVFIYAANQVGADEKTERAYSGDGLQTQFATGVSNDIPITALVMINGVKTLDFTVVDGPLGHMVEFATAPEQGSYIHVIVFGESATQPYSELHTQRHIVTRGGTSINPYTVDLDRTIMVGGPFETQVVVELNKNRLRPPTVAYYEGDGVTNTFEFPTTDNTISGLPLLNEEVEVFVNGVKQRLSVDYSQSSNIVFNDAPGVGDKIVISVIKFAEYNISEDGNSVTILNTSISTNDVITVFTFANHEKLGIKTHVYIGGQTYESTLPLGFDLVGFEEIMFDGDITANVVIPKFDLGEVIKNNSYLWITLDGRRLIPNYDFVIDGQYLYVSPKHPQTDESVLVVTVFGDNPAIGEISFRQFQDMTGKTEYLRIAYAGKTALAAPLAVTDSEIVVVDASKLPTPSPDLANPGVIFVNGERITYYTINRETNTLGQIRRGTAGTGATAHPAGTMVVDGSVQQLITDSADVYKVAVFRDLFAGDGSNKTFTSSEEANGFELTTATADSVQVYVGGKLLRNDSEVSEYTVNSVNPVSVTLNTAPPAGVWVAFEVRTGHVWYDIGVVDANDPAGSALANSTTLQAKFLKESIGFLP